MVAVARGSLVEQVRKVGPQSATHLSNAGWAPEIPDMRQDCHVSFAVDAEALAVARSRRQPTSVIKSCRLTARRRHARRMIDDAIVATHVPAACG